MKQSLVGNATLAPHTGFARGLIRMTRQAITGSAVVLCSWIMFNEMISFIDASSDRPFFLYWATPILIFLSRPSGLVTICTKFGDEKPYTGDEGYFRPDTPMLLMLQYLIPRWPDRKLVEHLKELDILWNTLIIFTSDNGPAYNAVPTLMVRQCCPFPRLLRLR